MIYYLFGIRTSFLSHPVRFI